ncbi:MAG: YfhO family protein [Chloroflexi bacterium]|nr:YfhO family protein [Chloroflexota bacterium]
MKKSFQNTRDIGVTIGLFALVCLFFIKFLFTTDSFVYNYDINYFYPHEKIIRHSLAQNEFPLWNPYFGAGSPQLSKIQVGLLYPPTAILRIFLPIVSMFNWDAILHIYLAGLGMYWLLRDLHVKRFIAFVCALAFMFSGAIMPRVFAGHVSVIHSFIWISWLLLAYRHLLRKQSWGNILLTVLFTSFVILGGHPQISAAVLFVPFSYFFFAYLPQQWRDKDWQMALKGFLSSAIVAILTAGLLAVQLIPFIDWLGQTSRGQGNAISTLKFMTRHSINLEHLVTPFLPYIWFDPGSIYSVNLTGNSHFWEISSFVTVTLLALLLTGLALAKNKKKPLALYFAGLALLGLVISMGRLNLIYQLLFDLAPIFRGPGRMMVLWTFSVTVLAGIYGDEVVEIVTQPEKRFHLRNAAYVLMGLFMFGFILLALWFVMGTAVVTILPNPDKTDPNLIYYTIQRSLFTFTITIALIAALFWIGQQETVHIVRWQGLLFFIVLAEMLVFVIPIIKRYPATILYRSDHPYAQLSLDIGQVRFPVYREPGNYLLPSLNHVLNGEEYFALEKLVEAGEQGEYLLGAGYIAETEPMAEPELKLIQQTDSTYLYEHVDNLPRVYAAMAVKRVNTHEEALAAVTAPTFGPFTQAFVTILESDEPVADEVRLPTQAAEPSVFTAEYLTYSTNSLIAQVTTDHPGIVIFSEMYYPGWEATVDGEPATIWRTNYAFRGVIVNEGSHIIQMDFKPCVFEVGLTLTIITMVCILFITAVINLSKLYHGRTKI